ncbi:MAG TPA: VanZ family protein [Steroidobacteraceae bacterium]
MIALRHRSAWVLASIALVLLVIWGSLQTSVQGPTIDGFDKFEHLGTYAVLAVWFTGFFRRSRYWVVVLALLGLGLALEIAQFAMHAGRVADPFDMAANAAGVALGVGVAAYRTGGWVHKVEAWLS